MCSICGHEHRKEIDLLLLSGESYRKIAAKYKLGTKSLVDHKKHCMTRTDALLIADIARRGNTIASTVPAYETATNLSDMASLQKAAYVRLMGIADKVEGRVDACIAKGEDRNLAPMVQSLIRSIESALGRTSGNINVQINNDIRQSTEWKAMMRLVKAHPELESELLSYLS